MADNLWVEEVYVNNTEGGIFGESGLYETWTDKRGELFRDMQREYGRCISRVYVDKRDGSTEAVGWVFEKRDQYDDTGRYGHAPEYYIRHVWVHVYESDPRT